MKESKNPDVRARGAGGWSQEQRLRFVDHRLYWEGRINRKALVSHFGISIPQASLDFARYIQLAPSNLVYDRAARIYLATDCFASVYSVSDPGTYLAEMLAAAQGRLESDDSFITWRPTMASVPTPGRILDSRTVKAVLRAIREELRLKVVYQSLTSAESSERLLSPHALAHDGYRWHIRAYCHSRKAFRDFVIARILRVVGFEQDAISGEGDREWHKLVTLDLAPHPGLPEAHRKAIELDYGMQHGHTGMRCRQALLFYVLRHLRLDAKPTATPQEQQIILRNRTEVERLLQASSVAEVNP